MECTAAKESSANPCRHWSVSCSILITAITLGRDFCRDIENVESNQVVWHFMETLLSVLLIFALCRKFNSTGEMVAKQTTSSDADCCLDNEYDSDIKTKSTIETQTDNKDYNEMTIKLKNSYKLMFSKLNRDIRELRKTCSTKLGKIKKTTKVVTKKMAEIQLKLPMLTKENKFLKEERNNLYSKIEDEAERKKDLEEKLTRLHTYLKCQGKAALSEPIRELVQT